MIINVDNFIDGESRFVSFSEKIAIPSDFSVNGNALVDVTGNITNEKGIFRFCGNGSAVLNLNCDLCLMPFDFKIDFPITEIFSKSEIEENDCWFFADNNIDLKPAILSNILLNMPMKAVCSDKCKGLCSVCGHNLNEGDCGCVNSYVNPEFEKLKALFEESENE